MAGPRNIPYIRDTRAPVVGDNQSEILDEVVECSRLMSGKYRDHPSPEVKLSRGAVSNDSNLKNPIGKNLKGIGWNNIHNFSNSRSLEHRTYLIKNKDFLAIGNLKTA